METERAEAFVLRVHPVTESSLLVTWYTRESGKVKTIAKGARRPKSLFRGKIDLFYRDEILFLRSKRSDLHLLQDCFLECAHDRLRKSVVSLTAASFVTELVELITEVEDPNPKIFDLLAETLERLQERVSSGLLLWFELHLLAVSGWRLRWDAQTGGDRMLRSLSGVRAAGAGRVKLTAAQLSEARASLWKRWDEEVGRVPRTRKLVLEQISH